GRSDAGQQMPDPGPASGCSRHDESGDGWAERGQIVERVQRVRRPGPDAAGEQGQSAGPPRDPEREPQVESERAVHDTLRSCAQPCGLLAPLACAHAAELVILSRKRIDNDGPKSACQSANFPMTQWVRTISAARTG